MAGIAQPRHSVGDTAELSLRGIMQYMSGFNSHSSTKRAGSGAVFGVAAKQVEQWVVKLHPFNVRTAHIAPPGIDSIPADAGAVAVKRSVRHVDERTVASILGYPRLATVSVARVGGYDLFAPL